jgi:hypothetical protein
MTRLRIALPLAPNPDIGATSGLQPVEAPAEIGGDLLMSATAGVKPTSPRSLAVRGADAAIGTRSPAQRGDTAVAVFGHRGLQGQHVAQRDRDHGAAQPSQKRAPGRFTPLARPPRPASTV